MKKGNVLAMWTNGMIVEVTEDNEDKSATGTLFLSCDKVRHLSQFFY